MGKCKTCYGYGMWAVGLEAPMGPSDSKLMPTKPCPECKANANPIREKDDGKEV